MNEKLWEHWLHCNLPIKECGRCRHVRRHIAIITGRACPAIRHGHAITRKRASS